MAVDQQSRPYADPGAGWVTFAMTVVMLIGVLNIIEGVVALTDSKFYAKDAVFVFSDLRTWGWIALILGALLIVAAMGVFQGSGFARWFGIFGASLNLLAHFGAIQSYPFWSLIVITLDILVIYALAVYGGKQMD